MLQEFTANTVAQWHWLTFPTMLSNTHQYSKGPASKGVLVLLTRRCCIDYAMECSLQSTSTQINFMTLRFYENVTVGTMLSIAASKLCHVLSAL